jgi:hypothetical protein
MREPSLRTSRLAIAGAVLALATMGGAGFYLGRTTSPEVSDDPTAAASPSAAPQSIIPVVEPILPLDRAGLLDLVAAAADAAASGVAPPDKVAEAVDRRFEIAVPFGCAGSAEEDSEASLRWRYEEDAEILRLHVAVTRWAAADWGLVDPVDGKSIEGFWIERPWASGGECPQRSAGSQTVSAASVPAAEQTLAIAQFFGVDVRREALRADRPFQSVQRIAAADFAAPRGFRLMLSGRIDRVPGATASAGPVHCIQPGGAGQRPRCVVAVTLDEVRIENPASGEVLATWPIGSD